MSRHQGPTHRPRYELFAGTTLLAPENVLSVERWPLLPEPQDQPILLSHLFDVLVSQLSTLLSLHYQDDFRPSLAYLRTPPLPFRRRPPQSNCPPCAVPDPVHGPRLEMQTHQGGISRTADRKSVV